MGGSGSGSQSTTSIINIPLFAESTAITYVKSASAFSFHTPTDLHTLDITSPRNREILFTLTNRFSDVSVQEQLKTYADQNADELDGISRILVRATSGSAVVASGETRLRDVFDGTTLATNPKQDALFDKRRERLVQEYEEETLPRIDESFNLMGRYGGGAHHVAQAKTAEALMAKMASIAKEIYEDSYFAERAVQQASYHLGIQYGTEDVKDAEMRRQAGLYQREYLQGIEEDKHKRWKYIMDGNVKRLQLAGNAIRSVIGSHVTETQPFFAPNSMQEIAGIALAGMGLAGSIYGSVKRGSGTQPSQVAVQTSGGANLGLAMPSDGRDFA